MQRNGFPCFECGLYDFEKEQDALLIEYKGIYMRIDMNKRNS